MNCRLASYWLIIEDEILDKIKNFELLLSKAKEAITTKNNQMKILENRIESGKVSFEIFILLIFEERIYENFIYRRMN